MKLSASFHLSQTQAREVEARKERCATADIPTCSTLRSAFADDLLLRETKRKKRSCETPFAQVHRITSSVLPEASTFVVRAEPNLKRAPYSLHVRVGGKLDKSMIGRPC